MRRLKKDTAISLAIALAVLGLVYLPTVQTIPNGSDHYYMVDVGETQVVLNTWGTLHATGYPLYVMIGNALVAGMRALGVSPVTAPALVSLGWGLVALTLAYALATHLTGRPLVSSAVIVLFGLTRTVWIHNVIAEVYTMMLALLALLLCLALWRDAVSYRIYWLALVGGAGVAHHRALALAAPALLYAVQPYLPRELGRAARILVICLALGLIGFLPYVYLPLRAQAGGAWVYGEPGTWAGFWGQFLGREANQYVGPPASLDALLVNARLVTDVLVTDMTAPGLVLGLVGLAMALRQPPLRRAALTLLISGALAYSFHVLFYTDVLSALVLSTTLSLAFGWLFLADGLLRLASRRLLRRTIQIALAVIGGMFAVWLFGHNRDFIISLTNDPTGLETIALVQKAPPGSTLMLAWGPRHGAVGVGRDVLGLLPDIRLVDHKADFRAILAEGMLVTPEYTFYNQPVSWWEERLGTQVYLRAVAPYLVQIDTHPEHAAQAVESSEVTVREATLDCVADILALKVAWFAPTRPERDLSVFVHLLDGEGTVLAQADQSAPVYGWRPLTTWEDGEVVRDVYPLPRHPDAVMVRYGLYRTLDDGRFENVSEFALPVTCAG